MDPRLSGITMDDLVIEATQDENRWTWHSWKCPCGCAQLHGPFAEASIRSEASYIISGHMDRDEEIRNPSPETIYLAEMNARPGYSAERQPDGAIRVSYSAPLGPRKPSRLGTWIRSRFSRMSR